MKKIKKLELFVTRYSNSKSKKRLRQVRQTMKTLIVRVEEVLEKAEQFVAWAERSTCLELMADWRGAGGLSAGDASGGRGRAAS